MKKLLALLLLSFISFTSVNAYFVNIMSYNLTENFSDINTFLEDTGISDNGSKFFIMGRGFNNKELYQFSLSTPYDISSRAYDNEKIEFNDWTDGWPVSFQFINNGNDLSVTFYSFDSSERTTVKIYYLSNPYNISFYTLDSSFTFTSSNLFNNVPQEFIFSNDGLKGFHLDTSRVLREVNLTTPFDLTTASYNNVDYDFGNNPVEGDSQAKQFDFIDNGNYLLRQTNQNVYEYSLSTPYDISTLNYTDNFYFINEANDTVRNISVSPDEQKVFFGVGSDVLQYSGAIVEPPTYDVELQTNFKDYVDFNYIDDESNIFSSDFNTTILNNEPWSITSSIINTGPFTFNEWFDLENLETFESNRTFDIEDPNRDYNLIANYTLDQSVNLSFDSNHPSPQNFDLNVETLEGQTNTITNYPFDNHVHPFDFNWGIEASTTNIGFYNFDYWYDNSNNEIYSFDSLITGSGINNKNLTATYSLPAEYQIDLTISTNIGFITFQLGSQAPITGTTINQTVSSGDNWTASVPNETFTHIFNGWRDIINFNIFSENNVLDVSNTNNDYYLEAEYNLLKTVNWDTDGGTAIPSQKIEQGQFVENPNPPSKPNFVFAGWYEEGDVNQTEVNFPYQVSDNITFVAIWLDTYTIDYYPNGGAPVDSETVIAGQTPTVVTPSRFGYTFEGWYTDNVTFNNAFNFNTPVNQNEDVYAKWVFGTEDNAEQSLNVFLVNSNLDDPFAQIIIVLAFFVLLNAIIYVYSGPMIVTLILNFILTALFMVLGFIPFWIIIMIFIAIFGFALLMLFGGRSAA